MEQPNVDPSLDLEAEIQRLKHERNAVILAHFYQEPEIQDLADVVGDSLKLAQEAKRVDADVIVFCGVHFMAETAKILNPERTVLLPDMDAGCSLAEGCPAEAFGRWRARHPDAVTISYINCTAAVKAQSDLICTSSNAEQIVASVPPEQTILFAPDRNLGAYLVKQTGREMVLWPGVCVVHETFSARKLTALKVRHPDAEIIAHPECEPVVLEMADFIGSTAKLLRYTVESDKRSFIVATEAGILHQMEKASPDKEFIPAPPDGNCNCSECPYMRLNSLEKLYVCLRDMTPKLEMDESLRAAAQRPIERMLALS